MDKAPENTPEMPKAVKITIFRIKRSIVVNNARPIDKTGFMIFPL